MSAIDSVFPSKKKSLADSYEEAAAVIEAFVDGRSGKWDWDDFTSTTKGDAFLESVRDRCNRVYDDFPAEKPSMYCSKEGIETLRVLARDIRVRIPHITRIGGGQ